MIGSFFGGTVSSDEALPDPAYEAVNPDYRVSDSPYLRYFDEEDCPTCWFEALEAHEVEDMEDPTAMEMYNVATGEIT